MSRAKASMTEEIFFDTDCLSSFFLVQRQNILLQLYKNRISIAQQVYDELKRVQFIKTKVDTLRDRGELSVIQIMYGSPEADLYLEMTDIKRTNPKIIGRGEASAIALAKYRNGVLASNNLRDIRPYIQKYQLKHVTTADILVEALQAGIINEGQGNAIWREMVNRNRTMPDGSFTEYLARRTKKK